LEASSSINLYSVLFIPLKVYLFSESKQLQALLLVKQIVMFLLFYLYVYRMFAQLQFLILNKKYEEDNRDNFRLINKL